MVIKQLTKLPESAKSMFDTFLTETVKTTEDIDKAMFSAWQLTKENYVIPSGKKSLTIHPKNPSYDGNYIEVMLGTKTLDDDNEILDFWDNRPLNPIVGDVEHLYLEKAKGNYNPQAEMFEGFVPIADNFHNKDDGSLWARVEIPNHTYTTEFLRKWEAGDYGVSIEFDYPDHGIKYNMKDGQAITTITKGTITGFTFTEEPAIKETKINESE